MRNWAFTNNAVSALELPLSRGALQCTVVDVSRFPGVNPQNGQVFKLALEDRRTGACEIVDVTDVNGKTFTIVRGREGTLDRDWAAGTYALHRVTAEIYDSMTYDALPLAGGSIDGNVTITGTFTVDGEVAFDISKNPLHLTPSMQLEAPVDGVIEGLHNGQTSFRLDPYTQALVYPSQMMSRYQADRRYVKLDGDTMRQPLVYNGPVDDPAQLVPKSYVDNLLTGGWLRVWVGHYDFAHPTSIPYPGNVRKDYMAGRVVLRPYSANPPGAGYNANDAVSLQTQFVFRDGYFTVLGDPALQIFSVGGGPIPYDPTQWVAHIYVSEIV